MMVPVSRRDTGFGRVIQHDSLITPEECGGPLVDIEGRLVGMNIARSDRTKTFALPVDVLKESIARMKTGLAVEKAWAVLDPMQLQIPLTPDQGVFRLHAQDAQIFGPTARFLRLSERDSIGCIGNWLSDRDEILWVIDNPPPGAYDVFIEYAADPEGAGTAFMVSSGEDELESRVNATKSWTRFENDLVGQLELKEAERAIISIQAASDPPMALMNLRSLKLVPVID
jgi:hypothetical protein